MNDQEINNEFRAFNLMPQRPAITTTREFLKTVDDPESMLRRIIDAVVNVSPEGNIVGKTIIETVISTLKMQESPAHNIFGYQDAFSAPKFELDPTNRTFIKSTSPLCPLGQGLSKIQMHMDRYKILKSYLQSTLFAASSIHFNLGDDQSLQLSNVASLISKDEENVIVFGVIDVDSSEPGTIEVEDETGVRKVYIQNAKTYDGIITVGGFFLVAGVFVDGAIHANLIGHPQISTYNDFIRQFWTLSVDPFGWDLTRENQSELHEILVTRHQSSLILTFSDVWVDVPSCVDSFNSALSQYDRAPPNMIIVCGPFTSKPFSFDRFKEFRRLFNNFVNVIHRHTEITKHTQFVFVPALSDLAAPKVFPRPPLPPSIAKLFPEAHFMTNPCRVRFLDQTITIFRDDLLNRLSGCAVLPIAEEDEHKSLLSTVLAQRHLCPVDLPHAPVCWEYDYTLRLAPPPDLLILADACVPWAAEEAEVVAFNPGQFGNGSSFGLYYPYEKRAEIQKLN